MKEHIEEIRFSDWDAKVMNDKVRDHLRNVCKKKTKKQTNNESEEEEVPSSHHLQITSRRDLHHLEKVSQKPEEDIDSSKSEVQKYNLLLQRLVIQKEEEKPVVKPTICYDLCKN